MLAKTISSQSILGSGATTTVVSVSLSTGIYLLEVWFTDSNSSGAYVNMTTLGNPLSAVTNGPTATGAVPYVAIVSGGTVNVAMTNPGATTTVAGTVLIEPLIVL